MINELQFIEKYENQKASLSAWGNDIIKYIIEVLKRKGYNTDYFIKIPVSARVKDNTSIIQKAFYRGKKYENPFDDITDKVGIRFVVLLLEDIEVIKNIIENSSIWEYSKDRDFEDERNEKPTLFEYQSVHYILKNKNEINEDDIVIPKDTPCEVQIRTLLQHAYSELTHDTIYKPKQQAEPVIHRLVARSMAMIETTDCIFKEVNDKMNEKEYKLPSDLLPVITDEYTKIKSPEIHKGLNDSIIDAYLDVVKGIDVEELKEFISKYNKMLAKQITIKYDKMLLFRQPIVLLIYYLVFAHPHKTKDDWPFTDDLLRPIYISLGKRYDDF